MLDVGWSELFLIGLVALLVVGPKDLPKLMREVGRFTARARGMARQFRAGWDSMVQEAELEEFRKQAEAAAMAASAGMKAATDPVRGVPELLGLDELGETARPAPPPPGSPAAGVVGAATPATPAPATPASTAPVSYPVVIDPVFPEPPAVEPAPAVRAAPGERP